MDRIYTEISNAFLVTVDLYFVNPVIFSVGTEIIYHCSLSGKGAGRKKPRFRSFYAF